MTPAKSINRRRLLQGASAVAAGAALGMPRFSRSASAQEGGKLVVASFYPVDQASGWDGLVKAFQAAYPGTEIEVQVTSEDYLPKILAQKASGTLPDVIAVENTIFPRFASNDLLLSLDEKLAATDFSKDDFPPKLINRFSYNGTIYGIPYDCQPTSGVFLNKKLLEDAGVEHPSNDWTWDEFMAAAETLTQRDGDRVKVYGLDPGTGNWQNWIYAHGGFLVDDVQNPTKVTTDTPEAIAGMQAYLDLSMVQKVAPKREMFAGGGVAGGDLFAAGQTAMYHSGYWELISFPGRWDAVEVGYVKLPNGPGGGTGYSTGGTCYSVSTGSKSSDLAFEFVKFFMGMEGWKAASEASPLIYPPAYIPAFNDIFMADPDHPVENKGINGTTAEFAIFAPADPVWTELVSTTIEPDIDLMASGQKPVAETLTKWAVDLTPQLTANKA